MTYGAYRNNRDHNSPPYEDLETAIALYEDLETAIALIAQVLDKLSHGVRQSASSKALLAAEKRIYALEQKLELLEADYSLNFATLRAVVGDKIESLDNRVTRNTEEIWRYIQEAKNLS